MVLETVKWDVKPGLEGEFESAFLHAQEILKSMKGYISHQFNRCIEHPGRYALLVNWTTLEDHTVGFRRSVEYQTYRALLSKYYEPTVTLEHYRLVNENTS